MCKGVGGGGIWDPIRNERRWDRMRCSMVMLLKKK